MSEAIYKWCDVREQRVPEKACDPARCNRGMEDKKCKHYDPNRIREERKMAQDQNPTIQTKDEEANVILQATRKGAYAVVHFRNPDVLKNTKDKTHKLPAKFGEEAQEIIERIKKDMAKLIACYEVKEEKKHKLPKRKADAAEAAAAQ